MSAPEPTGERFYPSMRGLIRYEHMHRYALCVEMARGQEVLDIASGEGYGSALLGSVAAHVLGVDADPSAVAYARHRYYYPNVRFLTGLCTEIPAGDASFDLVVSFETLEHLDEHDLMLSEIRRVLRPGGRLVISSPNKLVYSDEPGYTNPFHVRELYYDEFVELLERHFPHVRIHGQRVAAASFVYPLVHRHAAGLPSFSPNGDQASEGFPPLDRPVYFVAVCADDEHALGQIDSLFLDRHDDILHDLESHYERAFRQFAQQVDALADRFGVAIGGQNEPLRLAAVAGLGSELERLQAEVVRSNAEGSAAHAALEALRREHDDVVRRSSETVRSLEAQLGATAEEHARELAALHIAHADYVERAEADIMRLREMLASRSWRLTAPLRTIAQRVKRKR
jgi:SAM-dependent methyltransferase